MYSDLLDMMPILGGKNSRESPSLLLASNSDPFALERAAVVLGPLASAGKPHLVPNAPVAPNLFQPLDSQPVETSLFSQNPERKQHQK